MHIKQFQNGGIDCKIHGLHVVGRKRFEDDEYTSTISFLASDSSESEAKNETVDAYSSSSHLLRPTT